MSTVDTPGVIKSVSTGSVGYDDLARMAEPSARSVLVLMHVETLQPGASVGMQPTRPHIHRMQNPERADPTRAVAKGSRRADTDEPIVCASFPMRQQYANDLESQKRWANCACMEHPVPMTLEAPRNLLCARQHQKQWKLRLSLFAQP